MIKKIISFTSSNLVRDHTQKSSSFHKTPVTSARNADVTGSNN